MKRKHSSSRWLKEHFKDPFVKKAQTQGYRSRAAFKLLEIQQKDQLFKPGMVVVDLGAAPGGWSQVASQFVGDKGHVFAIDLLPIEPMEGVTVIEGDFLEDDVLNQLMVAISGTEHKKGVDVVLSDMAPNLSGVNVVDQSKVMGLVEAAFDFALQTLKPGGAFLAKVFQGPDVDTFIKTLRQHFSKVVIRKPKASRDRSAEIYLLGKMFKEEVKR